MNKLMVVAGVIVLIITCYFGIREPMSLLFIIPTFLLIGHIFTSINEKAYANHQLTKSERDAAVRFCAIGFLVISVITNVGFLFWVNSITPLWGVRHDQIEHLDELKEAVKKEEQAQYEKHVISISNAEDSVRSILKDPTSAKFSRTVNGINGAVCGDVNAKNSFGAYGGQTRFISINDNSILDDGSANFSNQWKEVCQ